MLRVWHSTLSLPPAWRSVPLGARCLNLTTYRLLLSWRSPVHNWRSFWICWVLRVDELWKFWFTTRSRQSNDLWRYGLTFENGAFTHHPVKVISWFSPMFVTEGLTKLECLGIQIGYLSKIPEDFFDRLHHGSILRDGLSSSPFQQVFVEIHQFRTGKWVTVGSASRSAFDLNYDEALIQDLSLGIHGGGLILTWITSLSDSAPKTRERPVWLWVESPLQLPDGFGVANMGP